MENAVQTRDAATRVAFVGLGRMGAPMALNLHRAGFAVTAYDLSATACEAFGREGGRVAGSRSEALADADVIVTMVNTGAHAAAIYDGPDGVIATARPGTLLIDCSTIDVDTSRRLAAAAEAAGLAMIDAPVSGSIKGAEAGTLTLMVGGSAPALERARPLLEVMGRNIFHAGPNGSGQAAKICNNMLIGVAMASASEALLLGEKLGLDRKTLHDIISVSSGQSWIMSNYCPLPGPVPTSPANRDYEPGFTTELMLKDMKLGQQAASSVGSAIPVASASIALYELLMCSGAARKDFSVVVRLLEGKLGAVGRS